MVFEMLKSRLYCKLNIVLVKIHLQRNYEIHLVHSLSDAQINVEVAVQ